MTLRQGTNTITIAQANSDEPANVDLMEVYMYSIDSDSNPFFHPQVLVICTQNQY